MPSSIPAHRFGATPGVRTRRYLEWGLPAAVLVVGALLSFALFVGLRAQATAVRRTEFERRAGRIALSAQVSFAVPLEVLRSVPALFEASDFVTRSEFRKFVHDALGRYPWIYALEWIPRVPAHQREKFEALAVADGIAGYHFKQDAPHGPPVPVAPRSEYFPLYYMEPPNETALGLEETALPVRHAAMQRARDLGMTVATERLNLVQDDQNVASIVAFHPVYGQGDDPASAEARRESLRGFAAAVFRLNPVIESALQSTNLREVDVSLVDTGAEGDPAVLYESRRGAAADVPDRAFSDRTVEVAGRRWRIRVADRAEWVGPGRAGWSALVIGLLSSALAAASIFGAFAMRRLRHQMRAAQRLGKYTLVEKLGEGGMGTVYRARHAFLRRPTAIKLLHPATLAERGPTALARFEREVQLMSVLTHPNTVVVYDYGSTPEGTLYYAMEYIDGITLKDLVEADGPQPPERVVFVLAQIASALAEAHAIALVHRDVKPANVMLCNRGGIADFVKVLDFGLVKQLSSEPVSDLSQSSALLGTPSYMAPEAIRGTEPLDARVDLYALGALAYYLLTGGLVFSGGTAIEVCAKHLNLAPDKPSDRLGRPLPEKLEALVLRCLEKDPDERVQSAEFLRRELAERALELPRWDLGRARAWWKQRGEDIEATVRARRESLEQASRERALEVDPRGRGRSEGERATPG